MDNTGRKDSLLIGSAFQGYLSYIKYVLSDGSKALKKSYLQIGLGLYIKKILIFIVTQVGTQACRRAKVAPTS